MFNIVVDMMGSDNGAKYTVIAVKEFLKTHNDVHFICVGKKEELTELEDLKNVEIVDARDTVKMDEDPFTAIKNKESSMMKSFRLVKENNYDGIVSFGGSAAILTGATLILGRIDGVRRPGFCCKFPRVTDDKFTTLLDCGANLVNTPEELVQFAKMGRIFSTALLDTKDPKVSLLANGAEEHKGTETVQEAHKLLKEYDWFEGNIEPNKLLITTTDVITCDGYNGNILLKATEGALKATGSLLKTGFKKNLRTKIGYLWSKPVVKLMQNKYNFKELSGAVILGVKQVAVKGHGGSDLESTIGALEVAYKAVSKNIIEKMSNEFKRDN